MDLQSKKRLGIDWALLIIVFLLMVVGVFMLANATGFPTAPEGSDWLQVVSSMQKGTVLRHMLWFAIGTIAIVFVMRIDYRIYGEAWLIVYIVALLLLVAVRFLGKEQMGQYRLELGSIEFQPSEFSKLVIIITLAWDLSRREKGVQNLKQLAVILLKVIIPLGVIMGLQGDLGTALVYVFITAMLLFISGTRRGIMIFLTVTGVGAIFPMWKLMSDNQRLRLVSFMQPELDPLGSGYNVIHSKMAIGSGGVAGKGFFNRAALSQLNYIPVQESDFIFAVTGETIGFIGSAFVILLYAALIIRMIWLANRINDKFGSYMIMGVAAMMFFHIFENIGMCIGIMPVTGIPLPFLSYGGSAMLTNMIGIGMVEAVYMRRKRGTLGGALI